LRDDQLVWFDYDPSGLADFVRRHAHPDEHALAERLMSCHRAAWRCGSYVVFRATGLKRGSLLGTWVVSNYEDHQPVGEFEEYGFDLDRNGDPVGVELLHRDCYDK
jgi:hypothetical protein